MELHTLTSDNTVIINCTNGYVRIDNTPAIGTTNPKNTILEHQDLSNVRGCSTFLDQNLK